MQGIGNCFAVPRAGNLENVERAAVGGDRRGEAGAAPLRWPHGTLRAAWRRDRRRRRSLTCCIGYTARDGEATQEAA